MIVKILENKYKGTKQMMYCENCEEKFEKNMIATTTWHDPGDYPSGAGGYALPSYDYYCCPYCESGEIVEIEE